MKNKNLSLAITLMFLVTTPVFAMLEGEGDVSPESPRLKSHSTLAEKKRCSTENKPNRTLPLPRKTSGSSKGGKQCTYRKSAPVSLRQICGSSSQDEQSGSPKSEQKESLASSKRIEMPPLSYRKDSNGLRRVYSYDQGNQELKEKFKDFLKSTSASSQEEKTELPENQSNDSQKQKEDSQIF